MSKSKINIYGELYNDTPNGHVTTSEQILDKRLNKNQEEINQELYDKDYFQLSNKPSINGHELNGDMNTSQLGIDIPTKTSDLVNDSNFISEETEPAFNSSVAKDITNEDITSWNGKQDLLESGLNIKTINNKSILGEGNITIQEGGGSGTSDYTQLSNKPKINNIELSGNKTTSELGINIPTKTSDLTNDSGFISEETEPAFNASPAKNITNEDITSWNGKQDLLESGQNIATINGKSLLTGENIIIPEGSGGTTDYTQLSNKPSINGTTLEGNVNLATPEQLNTKQDTLISGTNIKTINNNSILGEGNITIEGGDTIFLTCSSEANAANKVILEGADNYELSKRIRLLIKMTNANIAQEVTLSINNTDPKPLLYGEIPVTQYNTWEAGDVLDVYYDGTSYQAYPTNQPRISLIGNILMISGKQFALTPVSYYYVGWTNLSRSSFRELSEEQVKNYLSNRYNTSNNSTYSSTFGNNSLFMLAYRSRYDIDEILFTSGGITMPQDLQTDNTAEHDDITIDGQTYHIWGISHPSFAEYDQTDRIEIIFR